MTGYKIESDYHCVAAVCDAKGNEKSTAQFGPGWSLAVKVGSAGMVMEPLYACPPPPFVAPEDRLSGRIYNLIADRLKYPDEAAVSELATDILKAIREPTEAMIKAARESDLLEWSPEPGEGLDEIHPDVAWRAMIDAELK